MDTDTLRYSNVSFYNNNSIPVQAITTETRTTPILDKSNDWFVSIIRFDVDSHTLPINVPLMQTGSLTNTQSVITLRYLGVSYSQVVTLPPFIPQDQLYTFPTIYNYNDWLFRVNLAAALAFASIGIAGDPPKFIYDANTGLIDLFVDGNYISGVVNKVEIFMNQQLFTYFTNFAHDYQPINTTDPLLKYRIVINDDNTIVQPAVGSRQGLPISVQTTINLYLINDTAPSTGSWSSVRSLILQSTLLAVKPETLPNNNNQNNFASNNTLPILSDFLVPIENKVTDFRIVNEYLPTAQYRYLDLISETALTSIDIKFSWSDFTGNIYPLYMLPNTSFSVKLLFQKRNSL